jgi:hypothetical protein
MLKASELAFYRKMKREMKKVAEKFARFKK